MASMQITELIYVSVYTQTFAMEYRDAMTKSDPVTAEQASAFRAMRAAEAAIRTWTMSNMDATILAKEAES